MPSVTHGSGGAADDVLTADDGRRIGWHARGPRDGTPVLYLHGWPGSRLEQGLIPSETAHRFGVRLVSVDRPGWGNTDPVRASRPRKARDVLLVCDALGIRRFAVMGFSAGASHALTLAATAPDRVDRAVLASMLVPGDHAAGVADPETAEVLALFRAGRTPALEAFRTERRRSILDDPIAGFAAAVPAFGERERAWYRLPWVREEFEASLREAYRPGVEGDVEDCLMRVQPLDVEPSTIACPVRAVHGSADTVTPLAEVTRVVARIPDAELVVLNDMEHFGPLLFPDLLLSLACGTSG